jgi:hypothetical protein
MLLIEGLRHATSGKQRFQITTDGFQPYVSAITTTLSDRCDYAMHIKVYGANQDGERRYSPAEVISSEKVPVMGNPEKKRICTSHIERQNLTIRMQMRRMTRLTNAFSKKWDNLWSAYCLWFAYYNFCRVHQTLRVTPAMEAGLTTCILESGGPVGMKSDTLRVCSFPHGANGHPPILLLDSIRHGSRADNLSNHRAERAGTHSGAWDIPLGHRERCGTFNPPLASGMRPAGGDIQPHQFCP